MFIIRQATVDDAATLLKLAKMVHFINLPADPDVINRKIVRSRRSFAGKPANEREREFMFVLEDTETGNIIGTSSIVSMLSWPGRPHTYLRVRERKLYSEDLRTGQVHTTLQLGTDESGPSEIGGLILSPAYRGRKEKLGALLSLIRFHFIGLHREWFADRIVAEMMAPLTPDSRNTLWEYLGRRFINLSYTEADRFCQHSKEFITSLFPKEEIHVSLLPPEARNLIGKVGAETEPAKAMLESLGFRYKGHVDPFDGGPYLEASVSEIPLVTATRRATLGDPTDHYPNTGIVSMMQDGLFRAIRTPYTESGQMISIPADEAGALGALGGDEVGFTPLGKPKSPAAGKRAKQSVSKKKPKRAAKGKAATTR
jgi:arginine N-succinyltransferase